MLTKERLKELGYTEKEKSERIYFQKGNILIIHVETGGWEFAANHGEDMSDGIHFTTEEELNELIGSKK